MDYEFKSTKMSEGLPFDYFCVEDLDLDAAKSYTFTGRPEKYYYGNFFLFQIDYFQYFHVVHEGIGQYELLKGVIPDLKIVVISSRSKDEVSIDDHKVTVSLDMLKPYNITYDDIIFLDKEKPIFEKIFYYTTRAGHLLNKINIPQGDETYQMKFDQLYNGGYKALRILYQPYLTKNETLPKKIFFSRMKLNNEVRNTYRLLRDEDSIDGEDSLFLQRHRENYGGYRYLWQLVHERYMPIQEEEKLENFFIKQGYTIIDPSACSFYAQMNYCYNATHIAAIRGSSLLNTIFCDEDTNIFILDPSQAYDFPYEFICNTYAKNVFEIPFTSKIKRLYSQSLFTIDNIIGILETHYSDRI